MSKQTKPSIEPIITSYSITQKGGGYYISEIKTQGDKVLSTTKIMEEDLFAIMLKQLERSIRNQFGI
jgi:hypothetical protein